MLAVKRYYYVVYDDDKITEEGYVDPIDFEAVGRMIRSNLGELRKHIYEEYEDGTRFELLLADERLYKKVIDDGCFHLPYIQEEREKTVMDSEKFVELVKKTIVDYVNENLDITDGKKITVDDVYIVWMSKVLQNNKALASTTLFDGMYYELTYNGDKQELYVDAYKKWKNFCVKLGE